ncbi:hypothetical protein BH23PLA1_BH23PLA1_21310 [soil metagenome]
MAIDDSNPYAAPQARPGTPPLHEGENTGESFESEYLPNSSRAQAASILLGLTLLLNLTGVVSDYMQINLLQRIEAAVPVTQAEIDGNDLRVGLLGVATLLLLIPTIVAFCMWGVRAYRNLPALGARDLRTTPGWAAGAFFVPILNLFRPFQIYAETWKASDPSVAVSDAYHRANLSAMVVGWWWTFWLLSNVVNNFAGRMALNANATVQDLIFSSWASLVGFLLSAVAAGLAILVIKQITDRQEEKSQQILTGFPGGMIEPKANDWPFVEPENDFR